MSCAKRQETNKRFIDKQCWTCAYGRTIALWSRAAHKLIIICLPTKKRIIDRRSLGVLHQVRCVLMVLCFTRPRSGEPGGESPPLFPPATFTCDASIHILEIGPYLDQDKSLWPLSGMQLISSSMGNHILSSIAPSITFSCSFPTMCCKHIIHRESRHQ